MIAQKKVTVYYTEVTTLGIKKKRQRTIWVDATMADTWDWSAIEKCFYGTNRGWSKDAVVKVDKIKIGRAILQG